MAGDVGRVYPVCPSHGNSGNSYPSPDSVSLYFAHKEGRNSLLPFNKGTYENENELVLDRHLFCVWE